MDEKIVAMICISGLAITALVIVGNGVAILAAVTAIAGLAGWKGKS